MAYAIGRRTALASAFAGAVLLATAPAAHADFDWPSPLVIGTPGTAGGSFASTNGWAPILQEDIGVTVRVVPEDSEPLRFRRLTDRGEIAITSVSVAEMRFQTEGISGYAITEPKAQRIIWHHNDTPWSFVMAGSGDKATAADLGEGTTVSLATISPAMILTVEEALPAFLGMSKEEAQDKWTYVPAGSYAESCRAVVEGRADIAFCSPISSVLSEMEGAPGSIRWLNMDHDNTDGWSGWLSIRPMHVPAEISLGVSTARGVQGLTSNFVYATMADKDVDFVYNLVKWLHENHDEYKDTHPLAARMSIDLLRGYLDRTPMPVHEGTVKYLREIGKWSDADDEWNNAAIAKMDAWMDARRAALAEARQAGVTIDHRNEDFLAIMRKHTDGLEIFKTRL